MAEARKFYSRCAFGMTKVGETVVVSGCVDGRISSKGVQVGTSGDRKFASFSLSVQNQQKNLLYWAGQLGANETSILSSVADNGSEYSVLNVYVSERDIEYAEKNLKPGDVVDVAGFLRFTKSKKDDKQYVSLSANSGGIKIVRKADENAAKSTTPKEMPSTSTPEGQYTPEQPQIEEDDLPF